MAKHYLRIAMMIVIAITGERTIQIGNSLCDFWENLLTPGLPGGSDGKESAGVGSSAGDADSIPGSGRSPGERNGYPGPFLRGGLHGQRSLAGYSTWDHEEADF